ncbi:MAG: hypothetical protein CML12_02215 [Puniceicoccaceae bacterium]|nr:hypothetical protein [Puniceicoccaceae bacterium]RCL30203.1 MAG: hypothetical protein DBX03_02790 [Puniceicoccaceae bacterium]
MLVVVLVVLIIITITIIRMMQSLKNHAVALLQIPKPAIKRNPSPLAVRADRIKRLVNALSSTSV